jgi:hypothetical protein
MNTDKIISDFENDKKNNKFSNSRKNKTNFSRRCHQKKNNVEKKELMISRKKMDRLVTCKIRQRTMNKVEEQYN